MSLHFAARPRSISRHMDSHTTRFTEATFVAPPLHAFVATQPGWNRAPEIQQSGLLTEQQTYKISDLRAKRAFESAPALLANQGRYSGVVLRLLGGPGAPLSRHVDQKSVFHWAMRPSVEASSLPTTDQTHVFTNRSWRSEVAASMYNVAAASMQWVALQSIELNSNSDDTLLRTCIVQMANAESLLFMLHQMASVLLRPTEWTTAAMPLAAQPQHLNMWADIAFVQQCELFLGVYLAANSPQFNPTRAMQFCHVTIDSYDALYSLLKDQDHEWFSVVRGSLQRLIATKRHYYRVIAATIFIDMNRETLHGDWYSDCHTLMQFEISQTQKSLDKNAEALSDHVKNSIRADLNGIQARYAALEITGNAAAGWTHIQGAFTDTDGVPACSIRHPNRAGDMPTTLDEALAHGDRCALGLVAAIERRQGLLASKKVNVPAVDEVAWRAMLDSLTASAKVTPPVEEHPDFPGRSHFYMSIRRLGIILRKLAQLDPTTLAVDQTFHAAKALVDQQCLLYAQIIEAIFFDHDALIPDAFAVSLQDITNVALAIQKKEPPSATLVAQVRQDAAVAPFVATLDGIENTLRTEIQKLVSLMPTSK